MLPILFLLAYTDNEFDVAVLMEEAESKAQALERVADLEDELGRTNERLQELEVSVYVFMCFNVLFHH